MWKVKNIIRNFVDNVYNKHLNNWYFVKKYYSDKEILKSRLLLIIGDDIENLDSYCYNEEFMNTLHICDIQ